jgi:hypothetical protein
LSGLGQGGSGLQGGLGQVQQRVGDLDPTGNAGVVDGGEDPRSALFLELHEPQHHGRRYLSGFDYLVRQISIWSALSNRIMTFSAPGHLSGMSARGGFRRSALLSNHHTFQAG